MSYILVVDDQVDVRKDLCEFLESENFTTLQAENGKRAIELTETHKPTIVLLDMKLPDMSGLDVLHEVKKISRDITVFMITGYGDIPTAVHAVKQGADDFITKPPDIDNLLKKLRSASKRNEAKAAATPSGTLLTHSLESMLGRSPGIKQVINQIKTVAWSDFSVLIEGETGTGKSYIARAIHSLNKRSDKPFVKIDISSMPETLVESELFGHEKGAFTGADRKKQGYFEIANSGTLFIDELENVSPYIQSKLLHVVEERKVYPIGSTLATDIDIRIIAATNQKIEEEVREKRFREDLFYRIAEYIIKIPPLRERVEDIPFLAYKFLIEAEEELNRKYSDITDDAIRHLIGYYWPGNVRELKNVIRRAALLSKDGVIREEQIDYLIDKKSENSDSLPLLPLKEVSNLVVEDAERKAIVRTLAFTGGNKLKASRILQVSYKTLLTKIKGYGI